MKKNVFSMIVLCVFAIFNCISVNATHTTKFANSTQRDTKLFDEELSKENLTSNFYEINQGVFKFEISYINDEQPQDVNCISDKETTIITYIAKDTTNKDIVLNAIQTSTNGGSNFRTILDSTCSIKLYSTVFLMNTQLEIVIIAKF